MSISEDNIIKKARQKLPYTAEQIEELAKCMDPVNGPIYFIENYVYVQHVTHGKVIFKLYDYQRDLINAYHNHRYSISLVSRQMGKCLGENVNIIIKNKRGEVYNIPIEKFHSYMESKKNGEHSDITQYHRPDLR